MALGEREFTSEEVAALCGVTRVTVADWIARGKLDVRWTAGGHRRVPRPSLAEFMARQGYAVPRIVASRRALVLCVDDEAEWRERLRALLAATDDFEVECLRPGADALLRVGAARPDALVVDTRMPGFDVRQLLEAARAETALSATRVVALTTFDEEAAGVKRFGADAALTKERAAELTDVLERLLAGVQRRSLHPAPARPASKAPPPAAAMVNGQTRPATP